MSLQKSPSGWSFVEVILVMALVGIAIPPTLYLFGISLKEDSHTGNRLQALGLANSLMAEISQRRFQESALAPGNGIDATEESGFDRRAFDDIDDYQIFQASWGALSPPRDESGNALVNYSAFSQTVSVTNVDPVTAGPTARANTDAAAEGTTDFKLVTVTITWDQGQRTLSLHKIFANR